MILDMQSIGDTIVDDEYPPPSRATPTGSLPLSRDIYSSYTELDISCYLEGWGRL